MSPANPPTLRHLLTAALAAGLSYLACRLPEPLAGPGIDWGAGLLFGALVLAPLAPRERLWTRRAGLLAASALVYRGAVWLAVELAAEQRWPEAAACALAGALGAPALALGARPFLPLRSRFGDRLLALLAGAAGGALIGVAVMGPDDRWLRFDLPLVAGFLVWQVGWAAAHAPPLRGGEGPAG